MATRENGEQRGVGGGKNAAFAGGALARPGPETAPWVNVLANPYFGTVISESGAAYTWLLKTWSAWLIRW